MTVRGLHHAGVYVSDLAGSIAFYRDVFGLQVVERLAFGGEELAFLGVGAARLELIQGRRGVESPSSGVVDHFALLVDDLDVVVDHLRRSGVALVDEAPVAVPALGARILFCLGPDGERIELLELLGQEEQVDLGSATLGAVLPVAVDLPARPG